MRILSYFNSWRRRQLLAALCALVILLAVFAGMCAATGKDASAYYYNSYLLQAQAWLRGETALAQNYEHLELAIYDGKYYVSFPPVPSLPMVVYTLIWGDDVPAALIQKLYIAIACMVILSELARTRRMSAEDCAAWAILMCLGSAMLPISLVAGVWYEAQILAFLFSVCAIAAIRRGRPSLCCLFYALSVGCRPFAVLLGPVLLMMYIDRARRRHVPARRALARLVPGLIVGLCVAGCYAAYNYVRFDNPFEFGHNYLPEFTRSEHGQLSIKYVGQNWFTLLFGPPFSISGGRVSINQFGFSMFLSCPVFICNAVWILQDIRRRRLSPAKIMILAMGCANVFLLLMHRTLGGHQFGARYALELVPLSLCYLLLSPNRRRFTLWEGALMVFGLIFNFLGGCLVHI